MGFWDNIQKYNGKKLIEITLGFWEIYRIIMVKHF